jgi:WD40 repeat protein
MSTRLALLSLAALPFAGFILLPVGFVTPALSQVELPPRTDGHDGVLPANALVRMGTSSLRHGMPVCALTFDPSGKTLASAGGDVIRLWDTATGREILHFACEFANAIAFSPDGRVLVSGSEIGVIHLWETATGKEVRRFPSEGGKVHAVAFSSDGKTLASGHADGSVRLWDVGQAKPVRQLEGRQGAVRGLDFSPRCDQLAAAGKDAGVWDTGTGKLLHQLGDGQTLTAVSFTTDGHRLLASGPRQPALIWELATGKELRRFPSLGATVFSPRSGIVAGVNADHVITAWDIDTGKELRKIQASTGDDDCLALSADGKLIAAAGLHGCIRLWNTTSGKEPFATSGHRSRILAAAFSPDGQTAFSTSADGRACRWDTMLGKEMASHGLSSFQRLLAVSADGKTLAYQDTGNMIRVWDAAENAVHRTMGGPNDPACAAFAGDGQKLAIGYPGHAVHLWDLSATAEPRQLVGSEGATSIALSPDGKLLAVVGSDGKIRLWDIASGKEAGECGSARAGAPLVFSPDSKILAAGNTDGVISLREVPSGKELRHLHGHPDAVFGLAFAPDGQALASGGADPFVRLWEVSSGQELRRFSGHAGPVTAVAFNADGLTVLSGSADTTLLAWDVTGRRRDGRLQPAKLGSDDLQSLWNQLAGVDGSKAYDAAWTLVATPKESLAFLIPQVQLLAGADQERISQLITNLDSDTYTVREKAALDLVTLGKWAEPALRKTLLNPPSLEVQRRIEQILSKNKDGVPWPQERLRVMRIIQILERIGSPEAGRGLERLAQKALDLDLQQQAKAALERLARKNSP